MIQAYESSMKSKRAVNSPLLENDDTDKERLPETGKRISGLVFERKVLGVASKTFPGCILAADCGREDSPVEIRDFGRVEKDIPRETGRMSAKLCTDGEITTFAIVKLLCIFQTINCN